ncbi:putative toxin-antitoxin system toxin component, PIN family [Sulfurimonas sp.]|uniref:putative toxin-antitoxin system toxin component, PIN family n=1 Tax=Sulfurimonas sp. TaxID=2022749 RepID=UPI0026324736|nr:putative toxin-antitoxin system toxin component, PIN family [Sulfurimonas sp.]
MKIVIDTSVWISALIIKESQVREILRLVFIGKLHPQMGEALYREYESVMKRKKIQKLTVLSHCEQEELFCAFLNNCQWNGMYYSWRPNLKDEDDNFLVELAVASNAKVILTYNEKDFKESELLFNHKVITPENFIKEMQ